MWTVEVTSKNLANGDLTIGLVYTDGVTTIKESLKTHLAQSDTWLAECVSRRVDQLTALYTYSDKVAVGPVDYSVKPQPTPEEVIKTAFSAKLRELQKLQALNATGVNVAIALAKVKADIATDYAAHPELVIEVI